MLSSRSTLLASKIGCKYTNFYNTNVLHDKGTFINTNKSQDYRIPFSTKWHLLQPFLSNKRKEIPAKSHARK